MSGKYVKIQIETLLRSKEWINMQKVQSVFMLLFFTQTFFPVGQESEPVNRKAVLQGKWQNLLETAESAKNKIFAQFVVAKVAFNSFFSRTYKGLNSRFSAINQSGFFSNYYNKFFGIGGSKSRNSFGAECSSACFTANVPTEEGGRREPTFRGPLIVSNPRIQPVLKSTGRAVLQSRQPHVIPKKVKVSSQDEKYYALFLNSHIISIITKYLDIIKDDREVLDCEAIFEEISSLFSRLLGLYPDLDKQNARIDKICADLKVKYDQPKDDLEVDTEIKPLEVQIKEILYPADKSDEILSCLKELEQACHKARKAIQLLEIKALSVVAWWASAFDRSGKHFVLWQEFSSYIKNELLGSKWPLHRDERISRFSFRPLVSNLLFIQGPYYQMFKEDALRFCEKHLDELDSIKSLVEEFYNQGLQMQEIWGNSLVSEELFRSQEDYHFYEEKASYLERRDWLVNISRFALIRDQKTLFIERYGTIIGRIGENFASFKDYFQAVRQALIEVGKD